MTLTLSQNGFNFIENKEKFEPEAYKPLTTDVWTIGYGHTGGVRPGDVITLDQAIAQLKADIQPFALAINRIVTYQLNQTQFDALVSLVFNIGVNAFYHSSALTYLNKGDITNFCLQSFSKEYGWVHSGGEYVPGLYNRRQMEETLFLNGTYS